MVLRWRMCVCVCVTVNHRWKIIHKEALNFKPSCFTIPSSPSNQILLSNITVCMSTNRASSDSQSLRHCLFIPTDDIQTSYTTQTNVAYASWTSSSPTTHVSEYISTCLLLAKHKETATWWNPFEGTSFDTKKKRKETSAKIKHKQSLSTTALRLRTLKLTKPSPSVARNGLAGFWIRDPRSKAVTQDCLFCTADSKITVLLHVHNLFYSVCLKPCFVSCSCSVSPSTHGAIFTPLSLPLSWFFSGRLPQKQELLQPLSGAPNECRSVGRQTAPKWSWQSVHPIYVSPTCPRQDY